MDLYKLTAHELHEKLARFEESLQQTRDGVVTQEIPAQLVTLEQNP